MQRWLSVYREPEEELDLVDKGALIGQVTGLSGHSDPIDDLSSALRTQPSAGHAALVEWLDVREATVRQNTQEIEQQNRSAGSAHKKSELGVH